MHARDAWWYQKHHRDEAEKEQAELAKAEEAHGGIHMPYPSIWPLITSTGILIAAIGISAIDASPDPGIQLKLGLTLLGGIIMFLGIYFWSLEGNEGYHIRLDKDGNIIHEDHGGHH